MDFVVSLIYHIYEKGNTLNNFVVQCLSLLLIEMNVKGVQKYRD